jgi:hypothetical protein
LHILKHKVEASSGVAPLPIEPIRLPEQITASPAIANGRIYIRGWDNLYAISATGK